MEKRHILGVPALQDLAVSGLPVLVSSFVSPKFSGPDTDFFLPEMPKLVHPQPSKMIMKCYKLCMVANRKLSGVLNF